METDERSCTRSVGKSVKQARDTPVSFPIGERQLEAMLEAYKADEQNYGRVQGRTKESMKGRRIRAHGGEKRRQVKRAQ